MITLPWRHNGVNCEMSSSSPPSMDSDAHAVNTRSGLTMVLIKAIYCLCIKGSAPLTEKSQILKRWAEHFRNVLNCSTVIDRLPQVDTNNDLDLPPSLPETISAVQQISSGKAPGSDAIPPEVYPMQQIASGKAPGSDVIPPEVYKHAGCWLRCMCICSKRVSGARKVPMGVLLYHPILAF
ncbi:unnamed protein product [Schistocephalus solidus]|uniref:Uncharacterized protein n=1 Tax=Schistocephalus solidus TaxID=70667 RepID=A0A183SXB8_SCHSO|nr:unnamed protein product [Schistocephalus solidus]